MSHTPANSGLPQAARTMLERECVRLSAHLRSAHSQRTLLVGVAGAQGTGKSTLTRLLCDRLRATGLRPVAVSLDDFYLTHGERDHLAQSLHPLWATRGVPGTHDTATLSRTLDTLCARDSHAVVWPRFDKAADDRAARSTWHEATGPFDVVLFEGWCVGASPQTEATLHEPINTLEREEDPDGAWRRAVNDRLTAEYAVLFRRIDRLVFLKAPSMDAVVRWRAEQERSDARVLSDAQVERFVAYFERITRHMLLETPARADWVVAFDEAHRIVETDSP